MTGEPLEPAPPRVCRRRARVEHPMLVHHGVGDFVITQHLYGTADRGVFAGYEREHERDVLFTVNTLPRPDAPPPRAHGTRGIARLRYVGPLEWRGVLVEDEPPGEGIGPVRLPEATALTYAIELLGILHDAAEPLGGLAAQLVYADQGHVTEVAPRGQAFIASGTPYCYGVPTLFTTSYLAPELLAGRPGDEAADVFAAGVILSAWLTGEHPFDGSGDARIFAVMRNERRAWTGPAALASLMDALLAPDPNDRPRAIEAAAELERFRRAR